MGRGVNRVTLLGNLGSDPEVRQTQSGISVCTLSVATSYNRRDRDTNEWVEETDWHRVVLFQKLAEVAERYLRKGSQVYIEGKLKTRKWQDQDGNNRYSTEVVADEMQMLGTRGGEPGPRPDRDREPPRERSGGAPPKPEPAAASPGGSAAGDDFEDDIPF